MHVGALPHLLWVPCAANAANVNPAYKRRRDRQSKVHTLDRCLPSANSQLSSDDSKCEFSYSARLVVPFRVQTIFKAADLAMRCIIAALALSGAAVHVASAAGSQVCCSTPPHWSLIGQVYQAHGNTPAITSCLAWHVTTPCLLSQTLVL